MSETKTYTFRRIPRYTVHRYNDNPTSPSTVTFDVVSPQALTPTTVTTGQRMPGWRQKVRYHQNATTPRTITATRWFGGSGVASVEFYLFGGGRKWPAGASWTGTFLYPSSWPSVPGTSAAADNQARMRFYKRAKDAQTAFRGLTSLGELRETLRMIRNPGRALRTGLDDYLKNVTKRSRRAKRSSLGRIVSETWLEHAFGWVPLLSDIRSAGEALNRRLNRFTGSYTRVSGSGTAEAASFTGLSQQQDTWFELQTRRMDLGISSVRYVAEIRSVCENPVRADLQLFGVNWREVVPTAWELIPYSFLADYFTNIGDILDAWSIRKIDFTWGKRTERRRARRTISEIRINKAWTEANVNGFHSWLGAYVDTSYYRTINEIMTREPMIPALPTFRVEMPGLGTKWINMSALALARNRTRRQLFQ